MTPEDNEQSETAVIEVGGGSASTTVLSRPLIARYYFPGGFYRELKSGEELYPFRTCA